MEKLPMCRICLAENVRMYVVVNRNLHELYEKLTDIPFVTEDSRPILACFFCSAKLKQCYRLLRQCLEAEELFAQMMNEDYRPNPLINQDHLEFCSGFIKSPIEHISIDVECLTENIAIKEELPAVFEGLDDIIEPKEEPESDELEPEPNSDYSCLDVADIPPHHSELDVEDDEPIMEFKTEVEEVSEKKRRARETQRPTVATKPKLDTRITKVEDAITAEQTKKEKSDLEVIRTTPKRTSKPDTYLKEPYICDVCQRSFSHKGNLTKHICIHSGEKPYKCDVCQRSFSVKRNLSRHFRIHTSKKPYKCDVCQHSFTRKDRLSQHVRIHIAEKPYKCDLCQRSFRDKSNLTKHISIHTGEKPYKCDVCQRSFSVKSNLSRHFLIHTSKKPYKCDVCQHSFTRKDRLSQHVRIHIAEKPYKCDLCQRSFRDKSNLTRHFRIHTSKKPYKCDVCQHSFTRKYRLSQHVRIHIAEKPYKCDLCQRSFRDKSNLTKHISIHTGQKPYMCDVCQRSFSEKGSLTRHIRIHTSKMP